MLFYHISRDMNLFEGQTLVPNVNGLSHYGYSFLNHAPSEYDQQFCMSCVVEHLFEYVRQLKYPDRPSRFQSVYAIHPDDWDTTPWRTHKDFVGKSIWLFEAESYARLDASLLRAYSSGNFDAHAARYCANQYWSGGSGHDAGYQEAQLWESLLQYPVTVVKRIH